MNGFKELVHEEKYQDFDIKVYISPEHGFPEWCASEKDRKKFHDDIENGNALYFTAEVSAFKHGIKLASDYLGECCYESVNDFLHPEGYYGDMIDTAVCEARETILKLTR